MAWNEERAGAQNALLWRNERSMATPEGEALAREIREALGQRSEGPIAREANEAREDHIERALVSDESTARAALSQDAGLLRALDAFTSAAPSTVREWRASGGEPGADAAMLGARAGRDSAWGRDSAQIGAQLGRWREAREEGLTGRLEIRPERVQALREVVRRKAQGREIRTELDGLTPVEEAAVRRAGRGPCPEAKPWSIESGLRAEHVRESAGRDDAKPGQAERERAAQWIGTALAQGPEGAWKEGIGRVHRDICARPEALTPDTDTVVHAKVREAKRRVEGQGGTGAAEAAGKLGVADACYEKARASVRGRGVNETKERSRGHTPRKEGEMGRSAAALARSFRPRNAGEAAGRGVARGSARER